MLPPRQCTVVSVMKERHLDEKLNVEGVKKKIKIK